MVPKFIQAGLFCSWYGTWQNENGKPWPCDTQAKFNMSKQDLLDYLFFLNFKIPWSVFKNDKLLWLW